MSTNVYGPQNGPAPDFLRNTYDKQFQNLITTNFGELRPCFCKEVLPGDSVNIDPVVAIRSQPIVFPIQTRMKFYCHFFYGRNRILMKNWEDFIFKTKDGIVPPLLRLTSERAKKMISTGSLGDNLGVPSTINFDSPLSSSFPVSVPVGSFTRGSGASANNLESYNNLVRLTLNNDSNSKLILCPDPADFDNFTFGYAITGLRNTFTIPLTLLSDSFRTRFSGPSSSYQCYSIAFSRLNSRFGSSSDDGKPVSYAYPCTLHLVSLENGFAVVSVEFDPVFLQNINGGQPTEDYLIYIFKFGPRDEPFFGETSNSLIPSSFNLQITAGASVDATDDSVIAGNKFVGINPVIPISALPFRLYEFICNYYYRNDTNNPYTLDGEPQYNVFIPSTDDGWDTNEYLLHKRNWESDMFTTVVPSPQFGTAPLVGLTYNGGLTAEVKTNVTDSDGQTQELSIKVGVDDEGNINNIFNADTAVPSGSLKALMDAMSTTGISINTLRNVNSFQRFLENVIRRGLRYRNQLLSHFGVSVDYPDIDIPQFIGGFSGDLVVRDVTNMAESADVALGDVAGKIDAVIQSNHSINCYCAEHGFIMGIFCIVPVPTYSQVLPHMFTRYDAFDYFQKEFDKVGYVPVTYRNFLPLQADNPDEVFGYQRAWYEYMSSLDEVHGDFRLTLDDFVLYRVFKDKPTLNEEFLTVDSESLNNIFAVDKIEEKYKNSDKFLCQFYFQYSQKTMIPKHGVASLE